MGDKADWIPADALAEDFGVRIGFFEMFPFIYWLAVGSGFGAITALVAGRMTGDTAMAFVGLVFAICLSFIAWWLLRGWKVYIVSMIKLKMRLLAVPITRNWNQQLPMELTLLPAPYGREGEVLVKRCSELIDDFMELVMDVDGLGVYRFYSVRAVERVLMAQYGIGYEWAHQRFEILLHEADELRKRARYKPWRVK